MIDMIYIFLKDIYVYIERERERELKYFTTGVTISILTLEYDTILPTAADSRL